MENIINYRVVLREPYVTDKTLWSSIEGSYPAYQNTLYNTLTFIFTILKVVWIFFQTIKLDATASLGFPFRYKICYVL